MAGVVSGRLMSLAGSEKPGRERLHPLDGSSGILYCTGRVRGSDLKNLYRGLGGMN
jgi:hypothetical protein